MRASEHFCDCPIGLCQQENRFWGNLERLKGVSRDGQEGKTSIHQLDLLIHLLLISILGDSVVEIAPAQKLYYKVLGLRLTLSHHRLPIGTRMYEQL